MTPVPYLPRVIDGTNDPLVGAIAAIIHKYTEVQADITEEQILDALAYVYASVQRYSGGISTHPEKLN